MYLEKIIQIAFIQISEYNIFITFRFCREVQRMEFKTTKQAAHEWGISARRVAVLCEQGRIEGAVKAGKTWLMPPETSKPSDLRKKGP